MATLNVVKKKPAKHYYVKPGGPSEGLWAIGSSNPSNKPKGWREVSKSEYESMKGQAKKKFGGRRTGGGGGGRGGVTPSKHRYIWHDKEVSKEQFQAMQAEAERQRKEKGYYSITDIKKNAPEITKNYLIKRMEESRTESEYNKWKKGLEKQGFQVKTGEELIKEGYTDVEKGKSYIVSKERPTYIRGKEVPVSPGIAEKLGLITPGEAEEAKKKGAVYVVTPEMAKKAVSEPVKRGYEYRMDVGKSLYKEQREAIKEQVKDLGGVAKVKQEKGEMYISIFVDRPLTEEEQKFEIPSEFAVLRERRLKKAGKEVEEIYPELTSFEKANLIIESIVKRPLTLIKSPEEAMKEELKEEALVKITEEKGRLIAPERKELREKLLQEYETMPTWKRAFLASRVGLTDATNTMKLMEAKITGKDYEERLKDVLEEQYSMEASEKGITIGKGKHKMRIGIPKDLFRAEVKALTASPMGVWAVSRPIAYGAGAVLGKISSASTTAGFAINTGLGVAGGLSTGVLIGEPLARKEYGVAVGRGVVIGAGILGSIEGFKAGLKTTMKKPKVRKEFLKGLESMSEKKTKTVTLRRRDEIDRAINALKEAGYKPEVSIHKDYTTIKWKEIPGIDIITKKEIMTALNRGTTIKEDAFGRVVEYKGTRYYLSKYPGRRVTKLEDIVTVLKGTSKYVGKYKGFDIYIERYTKVPVEIGKPSDFGDEFKPLFMEASKKGYAYDPLKKIWFIKKPSSKEYYIIKSDALKNPDFWKSLPTKFKSFIKSKRGTATMLKSPIESTMEDVDKIITASEISPEIRYRKPTLGIPTTPFFIPSIGDVISGREITGLEKMKAEEVIKPSKPMEFPTKISPIKEELPIEIPGIPKKLSNMTGGVTTGIEKTMGSVDVAMKDIGKTIERQPSINVGHVGRIIPQLLPLETYVAPPKEERRRITPVLPITRVRRKERYFPPLMISQRAILQHQLQIQEQMKRIKLLPGQKPAEMLRQIPGLIRKQIQAQEIKMRQVMINTPKISRIPIEPIEIYRPPRIPIWMPNFHAYMLGANKAVNTTLRNINRKLMEAEKLI